MGEEGLSGNSVRNGLELAASTAFGGCPHDTHMIFYFTAYVFNSGSGLRIIDSMKTDSNCYLESLAQDDLFKLPNKSLFS